MTNQQKQLRNIAYNCLKNITSEHGFNASGKNEIFGCFFGRDSLITTHKVLRAHATQPDQELIAASKLSLQTLIGLQGKEFNLESGEQPGKFIHEFRESNHERLTKKEVKPWYVYPDNKMRSYDSIDATPLGLIVIYEYYKKTGDTDFLLQSLPAVEKALNWVITYGDMDKDFFLEYELPENRQHGGLVVQSWSDSKESIRRADGTLPPYPIASIEVQGIAWLSLRLWADFYTNEYSEFHNPTFGQKLLTQADKLKEAFNKQFIIKDNGLFFGTQALDGNKEKIKTITANPLICLWAAYKNDNKAECIVDDKYIDDFVKRGFKQDMFVRGAGIRTMSSKSKTFNPTQNSYHNGSFWPMLNGLITEGLENFGYIKEAEKLKESSLEALYHFNAPIELYVQIDGKCLPYQNPKGQISCFEQAWSAAATLDWLT